MFEILFSFFRIIFCEEFYSFSKSIFFKLPSNKRICTFKGNIDFSNPSLKIKNQKKKLKKNMKFSK